MKEMVLITGGNGMLARQLAQQLSGSYTLRFLTRGATQGNRFHWNVDSGYIHPDAMAGVNHIIHLAGVSIAGKRWTKKRRQQIIDSRVKSAALIREQLMQQKQSLQTFLSASAVGYYGTLTSEEIFTEESPAGTDFLSQVCRQWEQEAFAFSGIAERVAVFRMGIILSEAGGFLAKVLPPARYFLGTIFGNGRQYLPWIHSADLCRWIEFALENKNVQGVFNTVSPGYTSNKELAHILARLLKRPVLLPPIPKWVLRLFFGEKAVMLTEGSRVSATKIVQAGFVFRFTRLEDALEDLVKP